MLPVLLEQCARPSARPTAVSRVPVAWSPGLAMVAPQPARLSARPPQPVEVFGKEAALGHVRRHDPFAELLPFIHRLKSDMRSDRSSAIRATAARLSAAYDVAAERSAGNSEHLPALAGGCVRFRGGSGSSPDGAPTQDRSGGVSVWPAFVEAGAHEPVRMNRAAPMGALRGGRCGFVMWGWLGRLSSGEPGRGVRGVRRASGRGTGRARCRSGVRRRCRTRRRRASRTTPWSPR